MAESSSNLLSMFVLMILRSSLIMGQVGSNSSSLGQILEKSCLHSRGHISWPVFSITDQHVGLGNVLVEFDHAGCWVK